MEESAKLATHAIQLLEDLEKSIRPLLHVAAAAKELVEAAKSGDIGRTQILLIVLEARLQDVMIIMQNKENQEHEEEKPSIQ